MRYDAIRDTARDAGRETEAGEKSPASAAKVENRNPKVTKVAVCKLRACQGEHGEPGKATCAIMLIVEVVSESAAQAQMHGRIASVLSERGRNLAGIHHRKQSGRSAGCERKNKNK